MQGFDLQTNPSYEQLLKRLLAVKQNSGMKLGLENSLRLAQALGNPHCLYPTVHIAGTNGKGTVSTKIAAALQHSGMRVGLYTSPHLSCFRERIRINGNMISEKDVAHHLDRIFAFTNQETFFEITTLLAFVFFAENDVDIAIVETGLGGRLDATNILFPKLSVITSISLEHTEILGDTVEDIAKEKAGIIKPATPVVIGPSVPLQVISPLANALGSPCHRISEAFADYYQENTAIAKRALEILTVDPKHIEAGITAFPPCRLEMVNYQGVNVILDVCHNPDGFKKMLQAIRLRFPKEEIKFVVGLSSDKDVEGCLSVIAKESAHFHLVAADSPRALPPTAMQRYLINLGCDHKRISCETGVEVTVQSACSQAKQRGGIVVVCGTFYIMSSARRSLGIVEPQDPFTPGRQLTCYNECTFHNMVS